MNKKEFKTYEEQLDILASRGLLIKNKEQAIKALKSINYYNLINGYKDLFVEYHPLTKSSTEIQEEKFREGTSFGELVALAHFDENLRFIYLKELLRIEKSIKSAISYEFSHFHGYDHNIYLAGTNFESIDKTSCCGKKKDHEKNLTKLLSTLHHTIGDKLSDSPMLEHYLDSYQYIPPWILFNLLTFGNASKFYTLMKQKERNNISKVYKITSDQLSVALDNLSMTRNFCAHGERFYNRYIKKGIADMPEHHILNIHKNSGGQYVKGKHDIFSSLLAIKTLMNNPVRFEKMKDAIKTEMEILESELHTISIDTIMDKMGYPTNWKAV